MGSLAELIERTEKAPRPDREIDARVMAFLDGGNVAEHQDVFPGKYWSAHRSHLTAPPLTASLDAVVALVEAQLPGWHWHIHNRPPTAMLCSEFGDDDAPVYFSYDHKKWQPPKHTPFSQTRPPSAPANTALALLLAFLRAKYQAGAGNG